MMVMMLLAVATTPPAAEAPPAPVPTYTVTDSIGRIPDDVCTLAYHSGHWSDWLEADAARHRASRSQRKAMLHYCDGFIHGLKYKGQ